ncbi:general stress protein [Micrococcus sp. HSID17245]|uniref:general stress protein n=1 Tax=Micrococcus sp. HSID17245 TaxID=2419508 RepID=UPI001EE8F587|nr:general stress protein [Micrococcus sp. HSID17245]
MTQSTPQQSTPQHTAAQQPAPYGRPGAGGPALPQADYRILRSVPAYAEAQALVDQLSDAGFPVERVRIVGTGLRSVEQVLGRMTTGKAAVRGALQGLWFGLLLGLLFSIFAPGFGFLWILLISLGLGALWGAVFGAIGHAATGGRRDFTSLQTMEAESYDVLVEASHLDQAGQLLGADPGTAATPRA